MKRTCTHRDRDGWSLVSFIKADGTHATAHESHLVQRMWCPKCRDYVSFGYSDETDPRVAVEIRAVEIAANLSDGGCEMSFLEQCGFNDVSPQTRGGGAVLLDTTGMRAGYLAQAILGHDDTPEAAEDRLAQRRAAVHAARTIASHEEESP